MQTEEGEEELQDIQEEIGNEDGGDDVAAMCGCTACVVLVTENEIICANAGDSRSVLYYSDADPKPLSRDHKPFLKGEKERIEKAGGTVSREGE